MEGAKRKGPDEDSGGSGGGGAMVLKKQRMDISLAAQQQKESSKVLSVSPFLLNECCFRISQNKCGNSDKIECCSNFESPSSYHAPFWT